MSQKVRFSRMTKYAKTALSPNCPHGHNYGKPTCRKKLEKPGFLSEIRDNFGKSTVRGYNAPCFEGMVHCFMGFALMHRDNEDRKDNIKSAYRTA